MIVVGRLPLDRTPPAPVLAWAVPGLVMAVLGAIGIATPGLWGDELATWAMAGQPWGRTVELLATSDAVAAPYYAFLSAWTDMFGDSDLALRLPSLLAMAGAAALVGTIGARLGDTRTGIVAGLLFALLPGASRFAQEARVYALVVFAAVLATYVLIRWTARPTVGWLIAYSASVALVGVLHVVALLVLLPHGIILISLYRHLALRWLLGAMVGVVPALPLLWWGAKQSAQISWIRDIGINGWWLLGTTFGGLAVAVVFFALAGLARPHRRPGLWYALWALLPVLVLLALWPFVALLVPRYVLFTLPAWALLAATALARWRPAWSVVALAAVAGLAFPSQAHIRTDGGHENAATKQLAATIADNFRPGDGFVVSEGDGDTTCCTWVVRDVMAHYVPAARRPRDVFLQEPQRTGGQIAARECVDLTVCLGSTPRLWVVRLLTHEDPLASLGTEKEALIRGRYTVVQTWRPPGFTVALAVSG